MSTDICRWLFLLFIITTWAKYSNSKEIRVVCYYTNWSVYRPGTAKFSPQNINPYLCTHLIYAFGGFTKENTLKPFDKYQDIEKGGYAKFTGLKTYNKNLKTMLAIGGWNEGSSRFSPMVANPERRKELIKNAIKFLRQNHFDGLDLDWEYPSFRDGGKSRDRDNYAQLVQELREEFERESEKTGRPRLLLTMAVPAGIEYINKGYDVPKLTKYLDWMNILSYDYHSAFEPAVNHHAPLYPLEEPSEYNYDTELNIDYTIQHYLKKGADPSKLVLGIPTYGRSYTLFNPDANELGAPADGPGDMGEATRENGYLAYYEICEYIKTQNWEVADPNPDAMGPYAFKKNQWVGYDDDKIARKKAEYVAEKGLGGIMFWSIDNDDFRGNCHGKPYPIIEAAKEALISAYGLTDENLVSPPAKPLKTKTRTRTQSKTTSESSDKKKTPSSSSTRRRNRIKTKSEESNSSKSRRKETRRTTEGPVYSSLELVTPSYTTPAPPSTPDLGGGFKCEDEGFYPHPKDCKKYYWCLSGPGELGIVAHLFTCPAGLYFNKAADSCDYTRNVLCNKKLSKSSTTTTTTSTTEASTSTSTTRRVLPKITAATSRTTVFRTSTTTEAYEDDEYEYEDDVEENKNSEEDPKVIKELLDLIKKAGGIEELEKQLKIHEDGSASVSSSDITTPSSISKSLVERVLGKAAKAGGRKNSFFNRNSRGPQNEGLKSSQDEEKQDKTRPQYTTITRQRTQKAEDDESDDDGVENTKSNKKHPEYVNIRRPRVSTTTEEPEENSKTQFNRNKILGEGDEDEEQPVTKKTSGPQYVNIRRQRPSTTEETSTSKYTVIRRGTTPNPESDDSISDKKRGTTDDKTVEKGTTSTTEKTKYKILRRGSTTEATLSESGLTTSSSKRRGTTLPSVENVTEIGKTRGTTVSTSTSALDDMKTRYKNIKRGSTTETPTTKESVDDSTLKSSTFSRISSTTPDVTTIPETENPVTIIEQLLITSPESITLKTSLSSTKLSEQSGSSLSSSEGIYQKQTPSLLEPRPFSRGPSSVKPVTESSTIVTKVSDSNYNLRVRQKLPQSQTEVISTTILTTEKPTPFRTRAPSRFKQTTLNYLDHQTTRPTSRTRKRFSTTELYTDSYDEDDLNRTYRPSEIADLSSLTAVDFASFKELNKNSASRHRRPRPSTTTEKVEETLKTGSRTLPLARKLLDGTTFGNSRRVSSKKEQVIEDQINSSSDTTHRIRGFTRTPSVSSTTQESIKPTLRNRKVVRRLRPTTSSKLLSQNSENKENVVPFKRRLVRPLTETENLIENASASPINRRRTRPSIAEEVNKLTTDGYSLKNNEEQSEDVSGEEGENIKLSESNIRENSDVNNNNHNILSPDDGQKIRRKVLKRIKSKVEDEKPSTEPNVIVRTRKIVRKLTPTESTITTSSTTEPTDVSTLGRKRKIIRRLRPTTESTDESTTEKTLYIRGRPFLAHLNNSKSVEDNVFEKTTTKSSESTIDRSKYSTLNRGTTAIPSDDDEENTNRGPSRYRIYRPTVFHDEDDDDDDTETSKEIEDSLKARIVEPLFRETVVTTIRNQEDLDEQTEENESTTQVPEDKNEDTVVTTVKNYVNPILDRQRNRPTFKRPKLTTPNPLASSTVSKPRFKSFTRATTAVPFKIHLITEPTEEKPEFERKFVPKNLNRIRYVSKENKSLETTSTTEFTTSTGHSTTTETYKSTTTPEVKTTTVEVSTIESLHFDDEDNLTEISKESDTTEVTTIETYETTSSSTTEEDIVNATSESLTVLPETTTVNTTDYDVENKTVEISTETTQNVTETTPIYQPKSTLRSIQTRPKYNVPRRLTPLPESTTATTRPSPRFNQRNRVQSTVKPSSLKNRYIYRGSTTERSRFAPKKQQQQEEVEEYDDDNISEHEEKEVEKQPPRNSFSPSSSTVRSKIRVSNKPEGFSFRKTTETPKVTEDLSGIDTEAVKNRNKNLFSKKRKMNTPFAGHASTEATLTTTPVISESVTKPSISETTELLTTLHHIFAETELAENATEATTASALNSTNSKIEKLIEVNRIVEVHEMNNTDEQKDKVIDKVGVINRVTVVKVVDGNPNPEDNEINESTTENSASSKLELDFEIATVKEIPNSEIKNLNPDRENRKYEVYGASKVISNSKESAEIIDGRSNINVITPRPYYSTEASTISLEGLFQTDTPQKLNSLNVNQLKPLNDDELLETGNSRYVNVRVLKQEEDYITMKAQVVEVTPKTSKETIKIVPIKVEMSRKLIAPSDFVTKIEEGVPKVNLQIIKPQNK